MESATRGSVVVPAAASSSMACLRSLGARDVRTIVISEQKTAPEFVSRYCDERYTVPNPKTDFREYVSALLALAERPDVRAITPIREADVWALSRYRSAFEDHVRPLWPTRETLESVYDRVALMETATEAGVAVPRTERLDRADDWDCESIVKPRYAILTDDYVDTVPPGEIDHPGSVRYLEPGREPDQDAYVEEMGHVPIVQEFIPGEEYALWALYDHGEVVATCQKRQLRGYSYAGNTSVARQTTVDPDLETAGRNLLEELDWHGPVSVQFVRNENTGEFTLLEINPRFWVSLSCPIVAGVDFAYYYWQLACGDPVDPPESYDVGVTTHLTRGELVYLLSILREDNPLVEPPSLPAATRDVLRSVLRHPHFEYLSVSDPMPFLRDLINGITDSIPPLLGPRLPSPHSLEDRPAVDDRTREFES